MKLAIIAVALLLAATTPGRAEPARPIVAKQPQLQRELLERVEQDQAARIAMIERLADQNKASASQSPTGQPQPDAAFEKLAKKVRETDASNTRWLKTIIDKHGWLTISLVGEDGAHAAWLLVQHADADKKFQRKCLDLMSKLPKNEVSPSDVAYLTDRVLLAEGKEQIYGTQFTTIDGKLQPHPIKDKANVDARRAKLGLPPLAEYAKLLEQQYQQPSLK